MNELAVVGVGAISPAGLGVETLTSSRDIPHAEIPSLRQPSKNFPVFRAPAEPLDRWRREPRLRRASPITHLMVEAAAQAIAGRKFERLALVGAFFSGACHYSRQFFEPMVRHRGSSASPALFPDTVYNSSLSHAAHLLGVDGASYALVGDDVAWTTALQVASVWLELGEADHVLVLGAEELDAVTIEAYDASGWMQNGFVPAEGAAALLLSRPADETAIRIGQISDAVPHRSKSSARRAAREMFAAAHGSPILATAGDTWMKPFEDENETRAELVRIESPMMGHAFTATAGWNTLRGLQWLADHPDAANLWVPTWGLHSQVAALELRRPVGPSLAVSGRSG